MKALHAITFGLLIIGGLNWLAVGIVKYDISYFLGGMDSVISRIIYILVGVSAVYLIATHKKTCSCCDDKSTENKMPM